LKPGLGFITGLLLLINLIAWFRVIPCSYIRYAAMQEELLDIPAQLNTYIYILLLYIKFQILFKKYYLN